MPTRPQHDRPNLRAAILVDHGILLQREHGAKIAAAFLAYCGIRFAVIVRVTAEPARRRGCLKRTIARTQ